MQFGNRFRGFRVICGLPQQKVATTVYKTVTDHLSSADQVTIIGSMDDLEKAKSLLLQSYETS